MKHICISILNYNQREYLRDCLESVLKQTYSPLTIRVTDNNSTDGSVEFLKEHYPDIELIENKINKGYARAHNEVIRRMDYDYILLLNADVVLAPDFIEQKVSAAEKDGRIGMVEGKLYRMEISGRERKLPPLEKGDRGGFKVSNRIDTTGICMLKDRRNRDRGYDEVDTGQYDRDEYIFGASGAAPLYRREMLEDVGIEREYLDEDFFMYREEVDLSWRAQVLGWRCLYTPKAVGYHKRGYSPENRDEQSKYLRRLQFRNRYLMILKNEFPCNFFKDIFSIKWFEIRAFIYAVFHPFLLLGYVEFIRLIPRILRKRAWIMKRRRVSEKYMRQWFI